MPLSCGVTWPCRWTIKVTNLANQHHLLVIYPVCLGMMIRLASCNCYFFLPLTTGNSSKFLFINNWEVKKKNSAEAFSDHGFYLRRVM